MKTYVIRTCEGDEEVALLIEKWESYGCYLHSWQYDREHNEWIMVFKEG